MKSQAVVTSFVKPLKGRGASARPGRARLIVALLILAAPLAVAVWGLGGYSAQRERNNADTRLAESLNAAGGVYGRALSDVDAAATRMANDRTAATRVSPGRLRRPRLEDAAGPEASERPADTLASFASGGCGRP